MFTEHPRKHDEMCMVNVGGFIQSFDEAHSKRRFRPHVTFFIWWCTDINNNDNYTGNKWAFVFLQRKCLRACVCLCSLDSHVKRGSIGGELIVSECQTYIQFVYM